MLLPLADLNDSTSSGWPPLFAVSTVKNQEENEKETKNNKSATRMNDFDRFIAWSSGV